VRYINESYSVQRTAPQLDGPVMTDQLDAVHGD